MKSVTKISNLNLVKRNELENQSKLGVGAVGGKKVDSKDRKRRSRNGTHLVKTEERKKNKRTGKLSPFTVESQREKKGNAVTERSFESKESARWLFIAFLNLMAAIGNGLVAHMLYSSHLKNKQFLDLIEGYDGGAVENAFVSLVIESSVVTSFGFLVTNSKIFGTTVSRMRIVLFTYIGWVIAILIVLAVGIVTALLLHVQENIFKGYSKAMIKFSLDVNVQKVVHRMHKTLGCCGFDNYSEWLEMTWSDQISKLEVGFPKSCCKRIIGKPDLQPQCVHLSTRETISRLSPMKQGCRGKIEELYGDSLLTALVAMLATFVILIFCVFLSISNMKAIRAAEKHVMDDRVNELANKWEKQNLLEKEKKRREEEKRKMKQRMEYRVERQKADVDRERRLQKLKQAFLEERKAEKAKTVANTSSVQKIGVSPSDVSVSNASSTSNLKEVSSTNEGVATPTKDSTDISSVPEVTTTTSGKSS